MQVVVSFQDRSLMMELHHLEESTLTKLRAVVLKDSLKFLQVLLLKTFERKRKPTGLFLDYLAASQ
jgi:hypothetical protein